MNNKSIRRDILKLEKQMQRNPTARVVLTLAEKYIDAQEPHQAVAVLLEGIETFPGHTTLMVMCAKYMIKYQTDDISRAENLVKAVLAETPDNLMAQQILEDIHAQVDTMHEVAFGPDTDVLQSQKTIQVKSDSDDLPRYHAELTKAYRLFHAGENEEALQIFEAILEEDPDNTDAREGFRLSYTQKMKRYESQDRTEKLEAKLEVIKRSVHFLEAMKTVCKNGNRNRKL